MASLITWLIIAVIALLLLKLIFKTTKFIFKLALIIAVIALILYFLL